MDRMQWHMPIGYKVVDGKITICEEQRKIVEQIFTDYDSGVAAGRIAQNLRNLLLRRFHHVIATALNP